MRYLVSVFVFLLPMHALLVTFLGCKAGINKNIINVGRFWKEIVIIILLFYSIYHLLKKNNFSLKRVYKNNNILWTTTAFIICSIIYLWFPFFDTQTIHITNSFSIWWLPLEYRLLGFRYDVFFIFALIIWLYIPRKKEDLKFYLKSAFISSIIILVIFLPWYISGNIWLMSSILWYSDKVSTYEANTCISFAQNVSGHHRFQATFGWPIRFSVFLSIFYIISVWFILNIIKNKKGIKKFLFKKQEIFSKENQKEIIAIMLISILCITSIFLSYTKTSLLWLLFWISFFVYLVRKIIYKKKINKKFLYYIWWIFSLPIIFIAIFKRDVFLHLEAVLNRLDNLGRAIEQFTYNPFWGWLWEAWPATWWGIQDSWAWEMQASTTSVVYKFLPENWYAQIALEQWIVWLALFVSILIILWFMLYKKILVNRDYFSISMFTAFIMLCFMANLTHAFEEAATSYTLFLLIWMYLSEKNAK